MIRPSVERPVDSFVPPSTFFFFYCCLQTIQIMRKSGMWHWIWSHTLLQRQMLTKPNTENAKGLQHLALNLSFQ